MRDAWMGFCIGLARLAPILLGSVLLPSNEAGAENPSAPRSEHRVMTVRIDRTADDTVRERRWLFLVAALDHTIPTYGSYVLESYTSPMSAQREIEELLAGRLINVMAADSGHPELNQDAIPVPIPIDKGLLGYRIALIRSDEQARVNLIKGVDDLRSFSIGQGQAWGDLPIFEYNHIFVNTANDYASLFAMLSRGRFDIFPRGVVEIETEFRENHDKFPSITIDKHMLIQYTYAQFFYVNKDCPLLARRINDGLELMFKDGSFDKIFNVNFKDDIKILNLNSRVLIKLKTPFVPPWMPLSRKSLWLDPVNDK